MAREKFLAALQRLEYLPAGSRDWTKVLVEALDQAPSSIRATMQKAVAAMVGVQPDFFGDPVNLPYAVELAAKALGLSREQVIAEAMCVGGLGRSSLEGLRRNR